VQGEIHYIFLRVVDAHLCSDLLKLCDETELESLNSSLKAIVAYYQDELLPVAVDLAIRLVRNFTTPSQTLTHIEIVVQHLLTVSYGGRFEERGNLRARTQQPVRV